MQRTIDLLLNLEAKPKNADQLIARLKTLEKQADETRQMLNEATDPKQANRLRASLNNIEREMTDIHDEAKKRTLEKSLKAAEDQANRTRDKMEKIGQVGARLTVAGAAIIAPFALAVNKYVETVGEGEETSRRILALQERWTKSQVELGRVTAEILVPFLEKALDVVDKITAFADKNPGAVKAALAIGGSLVVIGGFLQTAATIVSTLATIQGLFAGAGVAGTAAGAGGLAAGGGLAAAVSAGIAAAAPIIAIAAAVVLAAEGTRRIVNWLTGTETTWAQIGETARQLLIISGLGWKMLFQKIGEGISNLSRNIGEALRRTATNVMNAVRNYFTTLANAIRTGLTSLANGIKSAFASLVSKLGFGIPKKASGGYLNNPGLFMGGEQGREFVLSNSTTRAAESIVGGQLSQASLVNALQGRGVNATINDNRRFNADISPAIRRQIADETRKMVTSMIGAIGR